jgi:sulfite exporter TauE/SafE
MCGGIVGALTLGLPANTRQSWLSLLPYLTAYNIGRLFSYSVAGVLVAYLGSQLIVSLPNTIWISKIISSGFMILLGLYLAGWGQGLMWIEKTGAKLWRHIEPFGRRFMPVKTLPHALFLGIIWGWLPCGLVYAALAWALVQPSAEQGGLIMLAFGLGTLPMLMLAGSFTQQLQQHLRNPRLRLIAGILIIAMGVYHFFGGHQHGDNANHTDHAQHSHHS